MNKHIIYIYIYIKLCPTDFLQRFRPVRPRDHGRLYGIFQGWELFFLRRGGRRGGLFVLFVLRKRSRGANFVRGTQEGSCLWASINWIQLTIWLWHSQFAMERSTMLLIDKPSINGPFSMAMLNNQRVKNEVSPSSGGHVTFWMIYDDIYCGSVSHFPEMGRKLIPAWNFWGVELSHFW